MDSAHKATGKSFDQWFAYLDKQKAAELSHKEIVDLVSRKLENPWWCQSITVAYEQYKGKRLPGQTADRKFQTAVSKTLNVSTDTVWVLITSEDGFTSWLGIPMKITNVPQPYITPDGTSGDITVFKQGSHIRLTWKLKKWKEKSTLELRVTAKGEKSVLVISQEGLPTAEDRELMKQHWTERIKHLQILLDQH